MPKENMSANSSAWLVVELQTFLHIVGEDATQQELDGSTRNEKVYREIAQRLAASGFNRSSTQCRMKLKKMKMQYKKVKDNNNQSGNGRTSWRCYDAMDAIYGHRPACQGREGSLDTATLESTVEPVDGPEEATPESASSSLEEGPSTSSTPCSSPLSVPGPADTENTSTPRSQYIASRRRRQSDVHALVDQVTAAGDRQQELFRDMSNTHMQWLIQDSQQARNQAAELYRLQREHTTAFNVEFLNIFRQLVNVLGNNNSTPS